MAYKSNIEGEANVANENNEEGANEAFGICEISHEEEMVNDDHDDRVKTAISTVCGVTPKAKNDKVHCVEVPKPVYEFFENIDDFNFVEEFDKIVIECKEDASIETYKGQAKYIHDDAKNKDVDDLVTI